MSCSQCRSDVWYVCFTLYVSALKGRLVCLYLTVCEQVSGGGSTERKRGEEGSYLVNAVCTWFIENLLQATYPIVSGKYREAAHVIWELF